LIESRSAMHRRISLILLLWLMLGSVRMATAQEQSTKTAPAAGFEERLGPDDGAVLAILFGGNLRGNLELCDCTAPRGGLARRVGYIEAFKKRFKDTPALVVDAGALLADTSVANPLVTLQNDQVLRAFSKFPVDIVNPASKDLVYLRRVLALDGLKEREASLPVLKNVVSANGIFSEGIAAPPPYLIKTVRGPRIRNARKSLRIGFVGLTKKRRTSDGVDATVKDPFIEARPVVRKARLQSDLLVIVAHVGLEDAMKLAGENPEANVVIAGDAEGYFQPRQVGKVMVVSAAPGNTHQGDLRVYQTVPGKFEFRYSSMQLDDSVPADPAAAAFVEAARTEVQRARYK
jgi:2',3'-cyclic-nucleotide 2'-phosphodiesterase (5'-nucleotidase family)